MVYEPSYEQTWDYIQSIYWEQYPSDEFWQALKARYPQGFELPWWNVWTTRGSKAEESQLQGYLARAFKAWQATKKVTKKAPPEYMPGAAKITEQPKGYKFGEFEYTPEGGYTYTWKPLPKTGAEVLVPGAVGWNYDTNQYIDISPGGTLSPLNDVVAKNLIAEYQKSFTAPSRAEEEAAARAAERAGGIWRGLTGYGTQGGANLQRENEELRWELNRQQMLAGMNQPENWINRWLLIKQQNPYGLPSQPQSWGSIQQQAERDFQKAQSLAETVTTQYPSEMEGTTGWGTDISSQLAKIASGAPATAMAKLLEAQIGAATESGAVATGAGELGPSLIAAYNPPSRKQTTPPAPVWLSEFVPGQVTGQPIQKIPLRTPSGLQWAATPWSVRQGLSGYAEWAGGRPMIDILEHMAMMQPKPVVGAGNIKYAPFRIR